MDNVTPNQSPRNAYPCRRCGQQIYWHKSKAGKHYPCDSPIDRRSFHQCEANNQPAKVPAPTPPADSFDPEPSMLERVRHLETKVIQLTRLLEEIRAAQPISDADLPDFCK